MFGPMRARPPLHCNASLLTVGSEFADGIVADRGTSRLDRRGDSAVIPDRKVGDADRSPGRSDGGRSGQADTRNGAPLPAAADARWWD